MHKEAVWAMRKRLLCMAFFLFGLYTVVRAIIVHNLLIFWLGVFLMFQALVAGKIIIVLYEKRRKEWAKQLSGKEENA